MSREGSGYSAEVVVRDLYEALLGRTEVREDEVVTWVAYLDGGATVADLARTFLASDEAQVKLATMPAFRSLLAPPAPPGPQIMLLHLPKTGGTSLRHMLLRHFRHAERLDGVPLGQALRMPVSRLRSYRFLSGHWGQEIERLLEGPLVRTTVIRDPIERAISEYRHHQRDAVSPHHRLANELSLAEWLRDPRTLGTWSNAQARLLVARVTADFRVYPHEDGTEGRYAEGRVLPVPDDEIGPASLERLARIEVVGTVAHLEAIYRDVCRRAGLEPLDGPALRENVGTNERPVLDEASHAALVAANAADFALLAAAEARGQQLS